MRKISIIILLLLKIMFFCSFKESKMYTLYVNPFRGTLLVNYHEESFVFSTDEVHLLGTIKENADTLILLGKYITNPTYNLVKSKNQEYIREIFFKKEKNSLKDVTFDVYNMDKQDYIDKCYTPMILYKSKIKTTKSERDFFKYQLWIVH